ncbi:unnamed protein product [Dracunculus medinensis]|uniref:IRS-type PTB domain-containing protein n=1 Tax=Dracunculus medinensis TaxID=318479 RepID=A0A0N4UHS6_DRAME|nr:unnamed protein product [Dracunculus medinensis]
MGNCVSQAGQKEFLRSLPSTAIVNSISNGENSESFRVFVKKRNKFIPGTLIVNENGIVFCRNQTESLNWPLHCLRRYGFTSAGIFFFESGRRCPSGEGLHTFQSHQAEAIFQLVQSKIRMNVNFEASKCHIRSQSMADSVHSVHSLMGGNTPLGSRIHPVQRYSSEGTASVGELPFNYGYYGNNRLLNGVRRPRSIATAAGHTAIWPISHGYRPNQYHTVQGEFMGSVINEHIIQRQPSILNHSYVNVTTHPRKQVFDQMVSSQFRIAKNNHLILESMAKSRLVPVYRSISETNSPACEKFFHDRYVNVNDMNSNCEKEMTPAQLDYAAVDIGVTDVYNCLSQRTGSISSPSCHDDPSVTCSLNVNYAQIDLEKTHAVEAAATVLQKENRLHYITGNSL